MTLTQPTPDARSAAHGPTRTPEQATGSRPSDTITAALDAFAAAVDQRPPCPRCGRTAACRCHVPQDERRAARIAAIHAAAAPLIEAVRADERGRAATTGGSYADAAIAMFKAQEAVVDIHRATLRRLKHEFAARYDERFAGQETIDFKDVGALGIPCDDCLNLVDGTDGRHQINYTSGAPHKSVSRAYGFTATCGRRLW